MVDGPLNFDRQVARPVPYTTAIARAMNMQAIVNGWLPEVRGWHTTVSDQFMLTVGGGTAQPTIMDFPITYDGVWVAQFASYFGATPVAGVYPPGASQPQPQVVPAGYRARVNLVSVEVGWVNAGSLPQRIWDPADFTRWFWRKRSTNDANFSVVPGSEGRPAVSRTLYGAPGFYIAGEFYTATGTPGPQMIRINYTAGAGTPFAAGQIAVFAGGATGIVQQSIETAPGVGFIWFVPGTVTNFLLMTGGITQLPTAGPTATAGTPAIAEPPALNATSYQQLYHYPAAVMPPIFLEPGDLSYLRIENYTSDVSQTLAVSISASGVMWPIGLEGS